MSNGTRGIDAWNAERWKAVDQAVNRTLERTARCRHVVPEAPEQIGAQSLVVATMVPGPPLAVGARPVASSIHLFVDFQLDDLAAEDSETSIRLVEAAAANLGQLEDAEIVLGAPLPPPPPPPPPARQARAGATVRAQLSVIPAGGPRTPIPNRPAGPPPPPWPTADDIYDAIDLAIAAVPRPGPFGLVLNDRLVSILRRRPPGGGDPIIDQVHALGGGIKIVDTRLLPPPVNNAVPPALQPALTVCGILFCLEPPAVDFVRTQRAAVTSLGRAAGTNNLRVEQDIVVRILDQAGIHHITY